MVGRGGTCHVVLSLVGVGGSVMGFVRGTCFKFLAEGPTCYCSMLGIAAFCNPLLCWVTFR